MHSGGRKGQQKLKPKGKKRKINTFNYIKIEAFYSMKDTSLKDWWKDQVEKETYRCLKPPKDKLMPAGAWACGSSCTYPVTGQETPWKDGHRT